MGRILDLLELEGHTVTIDAMGTQREFARKIISKKSNYLFALKGNSTRKSSTTFTLPCAT